METQEPDETHVDGATLVAEVRLSVNLNALTIEQVVAKLKRAQLDLVRLVQLVYRRVNLVNLREGIRGVLVSVVAWRVGAVWES